MVEGIEEVQCIRTIFYLKYFYMPEGLYDVMAKAIRLSITKFLRTQLLQFTVVDLSSFLFSVRLCWFLRGHSFFSSPPQRPMTSNFEGFSIPDLIHFICFPILILEKEPVFPFLMLKKGIAGTIFITSLA